MNFLLSFVITKFSVGMGWVQYVCSPLPDALPPRWDNAWAPPPGSCTGIASYSRPSAHQNLLYCHVCLMAVRLHQKPARFSINYDSPRIFCYIYINGSHNNKDTNIIKCVCIYNRFIFFFYPIVLINMLNLLHHGALSKIIQYIDRT